MSDEDRVGGGALSRTGPDGSTRDGGDVQERLAALDRRQRIALCREVIERLSELVEGEAPADFCERVADWLEDCQPFRAYRDTLAETIALARELGAEPSRELPLEGGRVAECVERVRRRLRGETA